MDKSIGTHHHQTYLAMHSNTNFNIELVPHPSPAITATLYARFWIVSVGKCVPIHSVEHLLMLDEMAWFIRFDPVHPKDVGWN